MNDCATRMVVASFKSGPHRIYFVGGCVRDAILGLEPTDIDFATDAPPNRIRKVAKAAGLQTAMFAARHGSVLVIAEGRTFELTTFRIDEETDGRRAKVVLSGDLEIDAFRRDFTINALYADSSGNVLDPVGGLPDVLSGTVRFIGDPDHRIREDYLRMLRFFRFAATHGQQHLDPDGLEAVRQHATKVNTLPKERIGSEIVRLLAAPQSADCVRAMDRTGILELVLPDSNPDGLGNLERREARQGLAPDPMRRLVALSGCDVANMLRLSRTEARKVARLRLGKSLDCSAEQIARRFRQFPGEAASMALLRAAEDGTEPDPWLAKRVSHAERQRFPVRASDLAISYRGAELGAKLRELELAWVESGFALDRSELLGTIGGHAGAADESRGLESG